MSRFGVLPALGLLVSIFASGCTTLSTPVETAAATPVITPAGGSFGSPQSITITDATAGAAIYYTTDGTPPTTGSRLYAGPLTVATSETIEAIAVAGGYKNSAVATAVFVITIPVTATPVFAPTPGSYASTVSVTITDATPGAAIYYTTNGTVPTTGSTRYTSAINVTTTTTFEAIATAAGYQNSAVAKATYTISPTGNQWTWMSGSQAANPPAIYGTMGAAAAANTPGEREAAGAATDRSGKFWLFGGVGTGFMNDLWQYDPATNEWTWVSGSDQPNAPGSYGGVGSSGPLSPPGRTPAGTWTDLSGNVWVFGGQGNAPLGSDYVLSDLWEFEAATQQWSWVTGPRQPNQDPYFGTKGVASSLTTPGALNYATSCSDNAGNLWLFGGGGTYAGQQVFYNDFWEFNTTTREWTWVSGSTSGNAIGSYGTKGVPSTENVPGARIFASCWGDAYGNVWLFGGEGLDNSGQAAGEGYLNDLWEYTPSTGAWTWVSGSSTLNAPANYGTQGVESPSNMPESRASFNWIDKSGNVWIFGGTAYAGPLTTSVFINDMWRFNPANGEWTWMTGSQTPNEPSTYGILGVPSPANTPGARSGNATWVDNEGNLWLFGQGGIVGDGVSLGVGNMNDVWRYQP